MATWRLESIVNRLRGCLSSTDQEVITAGSILLEAADEAAGIGMQIVSESLPELLGVDMCADEGDGWPQAMEGDYATFQRQYRKRLNGN